VIVLKKSAAGADLFVEELRRRVNSIRVSHSIATFDEE
jgi:hypothetical protein